MNKDDIYKYFALDIQLYNAVMGWIRDNRRNTKYDNLPYNISKITNKGGGTILLVIKYYTDNGECETVEYTLSIEDLERY